MNLEIGEHIGEDDRENEKSPVEELNVDFSRQNRTGEGQLVKTEQANLGQNYAPKGDYCQMCHNFAPGVKRIRQHRRKKPRRKRRQQEQRAAGGGNVLPG